MKTFSSIDAYIKNSPKEHQALLQKIRSIIQKAAPKAKEAIKYGMPTFILNGNLVHFAAMKNHIGFYPTPSAITAFKKDLEKYKTSKGAIQFPFDKVPFTLITRMTKFRVKETMVKTKKK